jgi:hypothetical protein
VRWWRFLSIRHTFSINHSMPLWVGDITLLQLTASRLIDQQDAVIFQAGGLVELQSTSHMVEAMRWTLTPADRPAIVQMGKNLHACMRTALEC